MTEPVKTPIAEGIVARVARGIRYAMGDNSAWFGPGQTLQPIAPEQKGRQFDYPVSFNTSVTPRSYEPVNFPHLRALADGYDLMRLAIETRKDQMCKMEWSIKPIDPKTQPDQRCDDLTRIFRKPDRQNRWQAWLRMLLEDLLVIDAPAIYVRPTVGGQPYSFDLVDGATIKRILDMQGRTPEAPEPAYQQVLKGLPAIDFTEDELIYMPRNVRTNKVYGYSPVEQVLMTVNIALRRQIHQLQYYTEGNVPESLCGVPDGWNPDQIKQFQTWWDSLMVGDTAARRHMKFLPGGMNLQFTKDVALKDEYDEWLARIICYAFSLPPTAFIKQMNRATAENAKQQAIEEGLAPMMQWVKDLIDGIIEKYFGYSDLEFQWQDIKDTDPLQVAQINQIYIMSGVKTENEVRSELGLEPIAELDNRPEPVAPQKPDAAGEGQQQDAAEQDANNPDAEKLKKKVRRTPAPRNAALLNRNERRLKRTLTKLFSSNKADIIKQVLAGYGKIGKADDSSSDNGDQHVNDILNGVDMEWGYVTPAVGSYFSAVATDSADSAVVHFGLAETSSDIMNVVNEGAVDFAKTRAAELVGKKWVDGKLVDNPNAEWAITDGTREWLRADVQSAIEQGWSTDELSSVLQDNYAFSADRADAVSRTEIARAHIEGQQTAYDAAGVEKKQWALSDNPCPTCEANANDGVIDYDQNFSSGDSAPPAHPNCVCDLIPILDNTDN